VHLSPVDESACNPEPKNLRQGERNPFNVVHDDLANYNPPATGGNADPLTSKSQLLSMAEALWRLITKRRLPPDLVIRHPQAYPSQSSF